MNRVEYYRAHIIRGKAARDLENLLPAYTAFIEDITPCDKKLFEELFNASLRKILERKSLTVSEKTLNNHRTEIAKKLFALYYTTKDGVVCMSERARSFTQLDDSVLFFKDLCFKAQFPNASVKKKTYCSWVEEGLSVRYYCYLTRFLQVAEERGIYLSYQQIGHYVLNNKHALTRKYSPEEIVEQVLYDRSRGGIKEIQVKKGENASYRYQHLREMCSLFVLSGIIRMEEDVVCLNHTEDASIKLFASHWNDEPLFDMNGCHQFSPKEFKALERDWEMYYSEPSSEFNFFQSSIPIHEIEVESEQPKGGQQFQIDQKPQKNNKQIGTLGEYIVYQLEKRRVGRDARFKKDVRRIKNHGAETGYGYDISSVAANIECDTPVDAQDSIYIEVKTTRRALSPDNPFTTFKFTKNEYLAARQHKDHYFIYHVVLFGNGRCKIYFIQNPIENTNVEFEPIVYDVCVNLCASIKVEEYSQELINEL